MTETPETNDQLILIAGFSAAGKSASLQNLRNQERWVYLNTEAGKRLPFKNKFQSFRVTEPYEVHQAFDELTGQQDNDGIILDSLTFLMDMYESQYIVGTADGRGAWGNFAQFFKVLMQEKVPRYNKPVLITAHVREDLDEKAMEMRTSVPIKGSLKNNGVEAYFSTVVMCKRMTIKDLEPYSSSLLNISEEEKELGYKHVFQTRPTKTTVGERIRSPMGLFSKEQTFMDNCAQTLLDHLSEFYGN